MAPRFYSISSSHSVVGSAVDLTVGLHVYPLPGERGHRKGIASSFLCGLKEGEVVSAQIQLLF